MNSWVFIEKPVDSAIPKSNWCKLANSQLGWNKPEKSLTCHYLIPAIKSGAISKPGHMATHASRWILYPGFARNRVGEAIARLGYATATHHPSGSAWCFAGIAIQKVGALKRTPTGHHLVTLSVAATALTSPVPSLALATQSRQDCPLHGHQNGHLPPIQLTRCRIPSFAQNTYTKSPAMNPAPDPLRRCCPVSWQLLKKSPVVRNWSRGAA